jgi:hypothetical protein
MWFRQFFSLFFLIDLNDFLAESRHKIHEHSRKIMRSRERKSRGSNTAPPSQSIDDGQHQATGDQDRESRGELTTRGRSTQKRQLGASSKAKSKSSVRVRESNRATDKENALKIARSPTPGSTDVEPEESDPSAQANCEYFI